MTPLNKEGSLIAVEVPSEAHSFDIQGNCLYFKSSYGAFENIGTLRHIPELTKGYKILGEVTKDEISFDVEPYVDKTDNPYWEGLELIFIDYGNDQNCFKTKEQSFYSLLESKGLFFVDPIPDHVFDWQSAEEKVIKGKLIILERVYL